MGTASSCTKYIYAPMKWVWPLHLHVMKSAIWCFKHNNAFEVRDGIHNFYMKWSHICMYMYLCMYSVHVWSMHLPSWSSHKRLDVEVNGAVFLWEQRHLHSVAQLMARRMAAERSPCELTVYKVKRSLWFIMSTLYTLLENFWMSKTFFSNQNWMVQHARTQYGHTNMHTSLGRC